MGNENSQIGIQYNHEEHHYGLSVSDATAMAVAMFKEYYPQLRKEALDSVYQMVEEKLKTVSDKNIVPPTARITIPTLQNASITEEPELRKLYANLLANSMNKATKQGVHPSYVEVINQLCSDEAKFLKYMYPKRRIPTLGLKMVFSTEGHSVLMKDFSNIPELAGCENILESEKYIDNFVRLGLLKRSVNEWCADDSVYEPLKNHPYIMRNWDYYMARKQSFTNFNKLDYIKGYCDLTAFGRGFCNVCFG